MHISFFFHSLLYSFRKEEQLVALLVYNSFRRIATSMLQRNSIFASSSSQFTQVQRKWGVITDSLRNQYSITAQPDNGNDIDVTRLVATEHIRNKFSLLEFSTPYCRSSILIHWQRQFGSLWAEWVKLVTLRRCIYIISNNLIYIR